jgi:cobalt-zinc-cadmium efflux system protein
MGLHHDHSQTHHNHSHAHDHDHGHSHHAASYGKAFAVGILLNIAFVLIEGGYGLKINSLALIADAGHNLSDVASLILAWAGLIVANKKSSSKHSYGWKKASVLAAFINSVFLLVAMGSLAWEAVGRFNSPVQTEGITIMIIAGIGILINGATALLFAAGRDKDINIRGAFLHMLADALISAGVVVSGALTLKWNFTWIDPVTSLVISVVIVLGTWRLLTQSVHLLFDGVPDHVDPLKVKNFLSQQSGVKNIFDLHIWAMSTTEVALTAHLHVPEVKITDDYLHKIKKELHDQFEIDHVTLQIVQDPNHNVYCN